MIHTYIFTQTNSAPCDRVLEFLANNKRDIEVVPLKDADGERTELAEDLCVELTPTMVSYDDELEETVDYSRFVGGNSILKQLA